jgi:hypothetical protein
MLPELPIAARALLAAVATALCAIALAPASALALLAPAGLAYVSGTATSPATVWAAQASGAEPLRLGLGEEPLIAPNGSVVAAALFGTGSGPQEQGPALALYSTQGAAAEDFLSLATATVDPLAWSPDSRYLAVTFQSTSVANIAAGSGLDVIDTQTGTVTTIAHGAIFGASFARDGSDRLSYAVARSLSVASPTNVYIGNPDGSGVHALTHDGHSLFPVWGPRYIAYDRERDRGRDEYPIYQIWLQAPQASAARRLTNVPAGPLVAGLTPVAFSGDGSRLLAEFGGEDTSEAWTVQVPSGRARRLLVHGRTVIGAGISASGASVLVDEASFEQPPSSGRIASVPFAGGASTVLVAHGAQGSWSG